MDPVERLDRAFKDRGSTIKRVCNGYVQDAGLFLEKIKMQKAEVKRWAGLLGEITAKDELARLQGLYDDSKAQALAMFELIEDSNFRKEVQERIGQLDAELKKEI